MNKFLICVLLLTSQLALSQEHSPGAYKRITMAYDNARVPKTLQEVYTTFNKVSQCKLSTVSHQNKIFDGGRPAVVSRGGVNYIIYYYQGAEIDISQPLIEDYKQKLTPLGLEVTTSYFMIKCLDDVHDDSGCNDWTTDSTRFSMSIRITDTQVLIDRGGYVEYCW